jgi:DNA-binding GntR family transcriptional regulator
VPDRLDDAQPSLRRVYEPRFDAGGVPRGNLPPSLPDHVRQRIEREIIELELEPGERVSEEKLAGRLGISRTPVREAMRVLEARGLIVRSRGRGARVARRATAADASALYELRVPIEAHLAGRAAELASEADLRELESIHVEFERYATRAADSPSLRTLVELDSDFHWLIYNAADSDLISIVASYWGRLQRELYDTVYGNEHPSRFGVQHAEIVEALNAREPEVARAAMRRHIETGWAVLRASLERRDVP